MSPHITDTRAKCNYNRTAQTCCVDDVNINPFKSVQSHTGLTRHFFYFWHSDILALRTEPQSVRM